MSGRSVSLFCHAVFHALTQAQTSAIAAVCVCAADEGRACTACVHMRVLVLHWKEWRGRGCAVCCVCSVVKRVVKKKSAAEWKNAEWKNAEWKNDEWKNVE